VKLPARPGGTPAEGEAVKFLSVMPNLYVADDAVAGLRAAGVPVLVEPSGHVSGNRRAYVADPDGNWIAVVSGEGAWA
jgi:catechol 2,3-dioxygenase-like lactoylglutathione lyase family enzyme